MEERESKGRRVGDFSPCHAAFLNDSAVKGWGRGATEDNSSMSVILNLKRFDVP